MEVVSGVIQDGGLVERGAESWFSRVEFADLFEDNSSFLLLEGEKSLAAEPLQMVDDILEVFLSIRGEVLKSG